MKDIILNFLLYYYYNIKSLILTDQVFKQFKVQRCQKI